MTVIRAVRTDDAPRLTELLTQLGYPNEPGAVTNRLAELLESDTQRLFTAGPDDDSRIDGYLSIERRLLLAEDEYAEITGLVVDSTARRSGIGRILVDAAEQWAVRQGLHTVMVRSNVARSESHRFYAGIGYQRKKTSHVYRKEI
ncbi:GNAT family N-acetyltransferase [Sciscionella marina]|uniref:GNAT family N-acetyltransferase n=1 Tax=Sciscionella marina TaxID=508770 RepID=UPI0003744AAD|nr:GNAT family N-acetyltransferase [Sciscionella marina]